MIYLASFLISILTLYLASRCQGVLRVALEIVALAIPCLLAAFRAQTIGTDVRVYGIWTFSAALAHPLPSFLEVYENISPVGFNLMSWVVANLSHSFEAYLGTIQLLTIIPFYLASKHLTNGRAWLPMIAYFLILFPISLNAMKQSIAIAFTLYATVYAMEKKIARYTVLVLVAVSFHQTAVVGLLIYPMLAFYRSSDRVDSFFGRWGRGVFFAVMAICLGATFIFGDALVRFVSTMKDSYDYQLVHMGMGGSNKTLIVVGASALVSWLFARKILAENHYSVGSGSLNRLFMLDSCSLLSVLGCVLVQLNVVSDSVGRIGYYLLPFLGLMLYCLADFNGKQGRYLAWILGFVLLAYFVYSFLILPGGEIYPYETSWGLVLR